MSVSRMLLVLAVASLASWWCAAAAVSREVVSVDGAVALFVLAAGSVVAGWYALTAMGHLVVALAGAASRGAARAQHLLRTLGAPALRHVAIAGAGLNLVVACAPAVTSAAVLPDDLRPGGPAAASVTEPATGAARPEVASTAEQRSSTSVAQLPAGHPLRSPGTARFAPSSEVDAGGTDAAGTQRGSVAGGGRPGTSSPAAQEEATTRSHTVAPGESLWAIAAAMLQPAATDAEIQREWRRWYAHNESVIGSSPHIIHPGQVLLAPDEEIIS